MWIDAVVILLLIGVNAFFAMAELAVMSTRRARLVTMSDDGHKGAACALRLLEDPSRLLSTLQVGITATSIMAGVFSGATLAKPLADVCRTMPALAENADTIAMAVVVTIVSYLTLVVGEIVPKRIGVALAESVAVSVAPFLERLAFVASPLVFFLKISSEFLLRLLRLKVNPHTVTEDEVRHMIDEGTEAGVFEQAERSMLEGVMRLTDRTVRGMMTPRPALIWFKVGDDPDVIRANILAGGHSRFLVAHGDDMDDVVGVVYAKDLLLQVLKNEPLDPLRVMRPPLIVPDTMGVLPLLETFRKAGHHQAVVVDEYGSVEGFVTLTDIMEAIAGAIPEDTESHHERPVQRDDGSWLVGGMTPLNEVEDLLDIKGLQDKAEDYHTIAGFMLETLGRLPTTGDHVSWNGWRFEIMDMDGRRIDKILITPLKP